MRYEKIYLMSFFLIMVILTRLMPHLPNFTPLIALSLFAGRELKQIIATVILLGSMLVSDALLAWLHHYAWIGSWTVFTYSGYIAIIWLGSTLSKGMTATKSILTTSIMGVSFWIWTNFGTWLMSGIYPLSCNGLTACFIAALPFLQNELLGDFCWGVIIFSVCARFINNATSLVLNRTIYKDFPIMLPSALFATHYLMSNKRPHVDFDN